MANCEHVYRLTGHNSAIMPGSKFYFFHASLNCVACFKSVHQKTARGVAETRFVVVVALLFYVHGIYLRPCRGSQLT